MNKNTGGPAFPTKSYDEERQAWVREEGMTLRDYFAAKAMDECLRACVGFKSAAEEAYIMADAMLKAREE